MFTTIVVTVPVEIAIHLWLVGLRFISTVPTTEKKHDFRYLAKYNVINSKNAIFTSWHRFISSGPTIHNLDRHKSPRNCTYPRSSLKEWFFGVRICCFSWSGPCHVWLLCAYTKYVFRVSSPFVSICVVCIYACTPRSRLLRVCACKLCVD